MIRWAGVLAGREHGGANSAGYLRFQTARRSYHNRRRASPPHCQELWFRATAVDVDHTGGNRVEVLRQLGRAVVLRAGQVRGLEIGVGEIGAAEARVAERAAHEFAGREVGAVEAGIVEIAFRDFAMQRALEVGPVLPAGRQPAGCGKARIRDLAPPFRRLRRFSPASLPARRRAAPGRGRRRGSGADRGRLDRPGAALRRRRATGAARCWRRDARNRTIASANLRSTGI